MDPNVTHHQGGISVSAENLNILSINIHSLRNKLDILEAEIARVGDIGIVVVSETWIEPGTESFYNLNGYVSYHEVRADGYGGLSVLVRNNMIHTLMNSETSNNVHIMSIKLQSTRIIAVYRQPSNNINTFLDLLDKSLETNDNCIMIGDTNIDILAASTNLSLYRDALDLNSMVILNKMDPDFHTFPQSKSLIDHFCVNFLDKAFDLYRIDAGISDHLMQLLTVSDLHMEKQEDKYLRTHWRKVTQLTDEFISNSSSRTMSSLHNFLTNAIALNTQEITSSVGSEVKPGWFNTNVNSEILLRDFLNRRRRDPLLGVHERRTADQLYRRQRNRLTSLIRQSKRREVTMLVQSAVGKQAEMWKVINFILTNRKQKSRPTLPHELFLCDDSTTTNANDICNELVDFFSNIAETQKQELILANYNRPRQLTLTDTSQVHAELLPVTAAEVVAAIAGLKNSAAGGYDRVSSRFIKSLKPDLIPYLVEAINDIFLTGDFPASFKVAKLVCIHKSGDPRSCKNYRPISILPTLCKILEKILYDRTFSFLHQRDFFHPLQFGFLPASNTTGATLSALNVMTNGIEANEFVMTVFIDVSKAFDCVSHEILLSKLRHTGITGPFNDILASYLFGRSHKICCDGVTSRQGSMVHGVPQGSRLSTLLFLVYVNDIFKLPLKAYMQLYADDILLIYTEKDATTLYDHAASDLAKINEWFYNNLLSFNVSKSKYMIVSPRGRNTETNRTLSVKGELMERVEEYKYLGLVIDCRLSWKPHIELMKRKVKPVLALLRRTAYLLPTETKLAVYYAHIHSHLTYLSSVWGSTGSTRLRQLERLQNRALRYIFWNEYNGTQLSTNDLYIKYNILKIPDLIRYSFCMSIFKIKSGLLKTSFSFATTSDNHHYQTRRRSHLQLPRSRTNYSRHSILHEGVNFYNALPSQMRHDNNAVRFKMLLKHHLIQSR